MKYFRERDYEGFGDWLFRSRPGGWILVILAAAIVVVMIIGTCDALFIFWDAVGRHLLGSIC